MDPGTAGLLGGVAQVLLVGEVKATIDIPYCDCGFKNEEIVSQVWAEMLIQSAVQLVVQVAALFAAAGVVVAARLFGGGAMPSAWAWLSYLVAAVVLVTAILAVAGPDSLYDLGQWLTNLLTGVLIPVWALWLALRFSEPVVTADAASDDRGPASASPAKQARAPQPFASAASACWAGPRIPVTRRRSLADSVRQPRVVRLPSFA